MHLGVKQEFVCVLIVAIKGLPQEDFEDERELAYKCDVDGQ